MRTFALYRDAAVVGVSGTGKVAEGVIFDDDTAVLRWLTTVRSTVFYQHSAEILAIHGHDGKTRLVDGEGGDIGLGGWLAKVEHDQAQLQVLSDAVQQLLDDFVDLIAYACPFCTVEFGSGPALIRHCVTHHYTETCPVCGLDSVQCRGGSWGGVRVSGWHPFYLDIFGVIDEPPGGDTDVGIHE